MTEKEKNALALFQHEDNRKKEEHFIHGFVRNENVNLAFVNEGRAFTDGINITVDPMMDMMFTDKKALEQTSKFLGFKSSIQNPWTALFFTSRAQEVHECLHIIFSDFPPPAVRDKRSTTKVRKNILALIGNIIEDSFIESAGVSRYPDMEIFLRWGRISHLFANDPSSGTVNEQLEKAGINYNKTSNIEKLEYILERMALELLYPVITQTGGISAECNELIEKVRPLFFDGSEQETPAARHEYVCRIFDILEHLIPEDMPEFHLLEQLLGGMETHRTASENSFKEYNSNGKPLKIRRRLFTGKNGEPIPFYEDEKQLSKIINDCSEELNGLIQSLTPDIIYIEGKDTDASAMHKKIKIKEIYPVPDILLEKSYKKIVSKYKMTINTYISRFSRVIQTENEYTDDRKYFGTGIASKNFSDMKKRYWYKKYYRPVR